MAKILDCSFEVDQFQLQSCNYIQFRTNTLGKSINVLSSKLSHNKDGVVFK